MYNTGGVSDSRWHDSLYMYYQTKKSATLHYFDTCFMPNTAEASDRRWLDSLSMFYIDKEMYTHLYTDIHILLHTPACTHSSTQGRRSIINRVKSAYYLKAILSAVFSWLRKTGKKSKIWCKKIRITFYWELIILLIVTYY